MTTRQPILIEGYTPEEILAFPSEQLEAMLLTSHPFVMRAGSAELLGEFRAVGNRLTVEMAQIEGGGEGVIHTLWLLVERYAVQNGYDEVEWIVHAVHCARPNPKLRRVLERRGFTIQPLAVGGEAYYLLYQPAPL